MNSQLDKNMPLDPSDNSTFDPQMATNDPNYLEQNASVAGAFANQHLTIDDPYLYQSLDIKGGLEEKVDLRLLRTLLNSDTEAKRQVLFYLARVGTPELDEELISFIENVLKNPHDNLEALYWGTTALLKTKTPRSRTFTKELFKSPTFSNNDLLKSLSTQLSPQDKILGE